MPRIFCVTSGKGGAGKSTIVSCLGQCLAEDGARVLLIDADVILRSLDIILNVAEQTVYNWMDVISGRCQLPQAILPVPGRLGLYVLPAPLSAQALEETERFTFLCRSLGNAFDFVLIDCPAGLGDGFRLAASPAEELLIVTTPDAICIRSAGLTNDALAEMGKEKVRLLINRFKTQPIEREIFPNIDHIIDSVGAQLLGVIPEDPTIVYHATKGEPLPEKNLAHQAFVNIAQRIKGKHIPIKNLAKM